MSNSKLMHYGISNDDGLHAINSALKTFVERVRDGDDVPDDLLDFVADGVERYLKGSKPWSGKVDQEVKNASKYGLLLALSERGANRLDMAEHLGISENRVSEMLHKKLNQRDLHKNMYLHMFERKSIADMLIELETFRKSEN